VADGAAAAEGKGAEPGGDRTAGDAERLRERSSTTEHKVGGLTYTATAGRWPLKDTDGTVKCAVSFVSYVAAGTKDTARPITFVFNGGPGSAAVWLHLGLFGPRRIDLGDGLAPPVAPYALVDNEHTLLDVTDLVFIDPVETGFSTAAEGVDKTEFLGLEEDVRWVGEFIRLWVARNGRWASPKLVAGESYGTTRAAGLASHLAEVHGMSLSGVLLISSVLLFQTLTPAVGNDLPHVLALPTLAATAWYHGKGEYAGSSLDEAVTAAEDFATSTYASYLLREPRATDDERDAVAKQLGGLIGLPTDIILRNRLRVPKNRFLKELRRDEGVVVAHFDGRIIGQDIDAGAAGTEDDPSFWTVRWPYTAAYMHYLRSELDVDADEPYVVINMTLGADWKWGEAGNGKYADVASGLRQTMLRDPHLGVFLANGYFDFATPFFAAEWTLDHLGLPPERAKSIVMRRYKAGHMMYTDTACLAEVSGDIRAFIKAQTRT
jgi:carboxypeptidase C (cathepsin A)